MRFVLLDCIHLERNCSVDVDRAIFVNSPMSGTSMVNHAVMNTLFWTSVLSSLHAINAPALVHPAIGLSKQVYPTEITD